MEYLTLWSHNFAEGLETQYAFLQKEEHVRSLEAQVAGWKSETETRDRAVQELTLKGRRDDAAIQALTARAAEKDKALGELTSQAAEKDKALGELTSQAAEKDKALGELTAQAAEKDKALGGLISQAAEKDERIRILSVQTAEREQSLRTLTGRLEETERALRDLSAEATAKDRTVQALTLHLAEIKGSTAWSIVRFLWRVRLFLLPHGSRREWIGAMTLRSLRVLRNEGVSAFLRKAGEKIRNPRDSTS
jgi:chromosome segregation ATPase